MNGKIRMGTEIGILLVFMLSACTSKPLPVATTPGGELTFEEHRAATPPPPKNLSINPEGNAVQIAWEPADPVLTPHGYGDEVLFFKVFRRVEGQIAVQLGTTTETSFLDAKRAAGDKYFYSVVEVHKGLDGGEVDGDRSDEVFWGG